MSGISNVTIEKIFNENEDDDFKKNSVSVFSSNHIIRFISFHSMIKEKHVSYLLMIMNTDRSNKKGMHGWSLLELHTPKHIFLYYSFGFNGFKEFIINDDKK